MTVLYRPTEAQSYHMNQDVGHQTGISNSFLLLMENKAMCQHLGYLDLYFGTP